jgi:hypothetical protein
MVLGPWLYGCTYWASPFTKTNEGFCGSKKDDLFGLVSFFLFRTKFGGHVPRILPPKNLSIAKFHEQYKYSNYIMWYKTIINVLEDSKRCLKVLDYIVTTCDSKEVLASGTSKIYNDD